WSAAATGSNASRRSISSPGRRMSRWWECFGGEGGELVKPSKSHLALGAEFYDPVQPATFPEHTLRYRNQRAAASVGLDGLSEEQWIDHFGRFVPLPDSLETPL